MLLHVPNNTKFLNCYQLFWEYSEPRN